LSSPVEFFDVLFLGIFITLSRALNPLFYRHPTSTPPRALDDEIASAESHFISLIHYFSNHHLTVLEGVVIDPWYIVKRMLAELAAAMVVFTQGFDVSGMEVDGGEHESDEDDIPLAKLKAKVDNIIAGSYPEVMDYYLHRVASQHRDFLWTGPPISIVPRLEGCVSLLGVMISEGEQLDLPTCPIFSPQTPPTTSVPSLPAVATKRRGSTHENDLELKRRKV
jgi:hypothetical protein